MARECWLGEALAGPGFHLLLCGPPGDWHPSQLTALRHRYPDTLAVHHLTREATPVALEDFDGQVLARLGVDRTAQYLDSPRRSHRLPLRRRRSGRSAALPYALASQHRITAGLITKTPLWRSQLSKAPASAGDFLPLSALAITDEASPLVLR